MSVCTAGFGVHTALLAFRQLSSVTEGFKTCWRTGQSAHLETILFGTLSSFGRPVNEEDLTLASTEGQVPYENQ